MSVKVVYESEACDCCLLWVANNDDSSCRDYYGHKHRHAKVSKRTMSRRLALLPATWSAFGWLACAANSEWEWAKLFGSIVVLLVVFALSAPVARKD